MISLAKMGKINRDERKDGDILHAMIGICTRDATVYGYVSSVLRREGIPYQVMGSSWEVLDDFDLIITSCEEEVLLRIQFDANGATRGRNGGFLPPILGIALESPLNDGMLRTLPLSNLRKLESTFHHSRLIIALDPGEHVGIVVLSDSSFLMAETLSFDIKKITNYVKALIERFPSNHIVIKIGNGEEVYAYPLINALCTVFQVDIEAGLLEIRMVNERNTSTKKKFSRKTILSIHEYSALLIAGRNGRLVTSPVHVLITNGRVKDLKRKSRRLSNGAITISTELAEEVIKGEITLKDAINRQKSK